MTESLLDVFANLDLAVKHTLDDITTPRLRALATLEIAELNTGADRLTVEEITACLEAAGVAVKSLSIARALAAAAGFVSSRRENGETSYKIMTKGKKQIEPYLSQAKLSVIRIEKDRPRTARLELKEIFSGTKGIVRICDPYYGIRTLDALDHIPESCEIRFLSVNATDSATKLNSAIKDFVKERPKSEFRVADKSAGIHDRYLITNDLIVILGHGLKDIGGKESFVISLDKSLVPDLIADTIGAFDSKWSSAKPV